MRELTSSDFDENLSANDIVVVDFWAPWCGPCRALGPIMEQLSTEIANIAMVAKINIDECPELAERFGIQSIPTIIFFKNALEVGRKVGVSTKSDLMEVIKTLQN